MLMIINKTGCAFWVVLRLLFVAELFSKSTMAADNVTYSDFGKVPVSAADLTSADRARSSGSLSIPKRIGIRVVNACVDEAKKLNKSKREGVDLTFKGISLARDIRSGEFAAYRLLKYEGNDVLEITRASEQLRKVPMEFEANCFYTIVLSGNSSQAGKNLQMQIKRDYPLAASQMHPQKGVVSLINGVNEYPVGVTISGLQRRVLQPNEHIVLFLPSGVYSCILDFPYKQNQTRTTSDRLEVSAGANYTMIVLAAPEHPDRPVMLVFNDSEQAQAALATERFLEDASQKAALQR